MPPIPATLIFGSLTALILALLGANVSRVRGVKNSYIGGAVDDDLLRTIRAHGNATEWVPILVLMLLVLELGGAGSGKLHLLGSAMVVSRLLHGLGVLFKSKVSVVGASITYALAIGMPIYGVMLHLRAAHP